MIDEQPRQIEHPRHPGDDGDDVQCEQPAVHGRNVVGVCGSVLAGLGFCQRGAKHRVIGLQADGFSEIGYRARQFPFCDVGLAATMEAARIFRIAPYRFVVVGDGAIVILFAR